MSVGERPEMTLRDYWRVIVRRSWIVIAAIIATAAPAVALSAQQSPIYEADADMLIHALPGESVFGSGQQSINPDRLVQNEISVLEGDVVYAGLIENLGLEDDPPGVTGSGFDDADVITVSVQSGDPETAATLADAYVDAYIDVKREQAVDGMVAASTELQTKITELQTQIDALDAQHRRQFSTDDDSSAEADRRALVDQQALFRQRIDQLQVDAALSAGNAELVRPAAVPSQADQAHARAHRDACRGRRAAVGSRCCIPGRPPRRLGAQQRRPRQRLGTDVPVLATVPECVRVATTDR